MGLFLQWIGVERGDKAKILERLGFEVVGQGEGVSGDFLCTETSGGWLIIVAQRTGLPLEEALASLAGEPFVLSGQYIETVNYNTLRALRNGITAWSIARDTDKALDDLIIEGEPPPQFADIRHRIPQSEREEDVDYLFDMPTELAQSICGYPFDDPGHSWDLLFRIGPIKPAEPRQESLAAIFEAHVLPELKARGWEASGALVDIDHPVAIVRCVAGREQGLYFQVDEGEQARIAVKFAVKPSSIGSSNSVAGVVDQRPKPPSLLKRLFGAKPPKVFDPVDHAIRAARADILVAEHFLETGDRSTAIQLSSKP